MPRRRRRIVLLHAHCRGELTRGPHGVWTCRTCGGKVEIGGQQYTRRGKLNRPSWSGQAGFLTIGLALAGLLVGLGLGVFDLTVRHRATVDEPFIRLFRSFGERQRGYVAPRRPCKTLRATSEAVSVVNFNVYGERRSQHWCKGSSRAIPKREGDCLLDPVPGFKNEIQLLGATKFHRRRILADRQERRRTLATIPNKESNGGVIGTEKGLIGILINHPKYLPFFGLQVRAILQDHHALLRIGHPSVDRHDAFELCDIRSERRRDPFHSLGGSASFSDRGSRFSQPVLHVFRLTQHRNPLEYRDERQRAGKPNDPPILRRFLIALIAGVGGYGLALWGDGQSRNGRKWRGRTCTWIAGILFGGTCVLLFMTGFRWSWGWWL